MRFQHGVAPNENYVEGMVNAPPIYSVYDNTANDSDKTFTVPDGEMWKLNWARVVLASTATVGNRQMRLSVIDDSSNVVASLDAGTVQAESLTRDYNFMQGVYRETAFINGELQIPFFQDLYLPAGWGIRFHDSAAIDPAADDMTVSFQATRLKGC